MGGDWKGFLTNWCWTNITVLRRSGNTVIMNHSEQNIPALKYFKVFPSEFCYSIHWVKVMQYCLKPLQSWNPFILVSVAFGSTALSEMSALSHQNYCTYCHFSLLSYFWYELNSELVSEMWRQWVLPCLSLSTDIELVLCYREMHVFEER